MNNNRKQYEGFLIKDYIVKLDDSLSEKAWWNAIIDIKPYTIRMEIISVIFPTLLITINDSDIQHIKNILGVKNIEPEETYELY